MSSRNVLPLNVLKRPQRPNKLANQVVDDVQKEQPVSSIEQAYSLLLSKFQTVSSIVDKLDLGIIILDDFDRIELCNASAQRMGKDSHLFRTLHCRPINFRDKETASRFNRTLTAVRIERSNIKSVTPHRLTVKDEYDNDFFLFELEPVFSKSVNSSPDYRGVAIRIVDLRMQHSELVNSFARLFSLTQAEREIIKLISKGLTAKEISKVRKTTLLTVRGQLKTIFKKTGAGSQLDLLHRILSVNCYASI